MSEAGNCLAMLCGGCCMAIGLAATSLLDLRSLLPFFEEMLYIDAGDCSHGWCGCCCKDAFDEEEHFERQMQKEMERTRDKSRYKLVVPVETEPEATEGMIRGSSTTHPSYDVPLTTGNPA